MDHTVTSLFWWGVAGWVLLVFAMTLGAGRSVAFALFSTFISCLVMIDAVAMVSGVVLPVIQKAQIGWKFVCFFVVAPYAFTILRLYVLSKRRPRPIGPQQ